MHGIRLASQPASRALGHAYLQKDEIELQFSQRHTLAGASCNCPKHFSGV
jgi:hypothetical protein